MMRMRQVSTLALGGLQRSTTSVCRTPFHAGAGFGIRTAQGRTITQVSLEAARMIAGSHGGSLSQARASSSFKYARTSGSLTAVLSNAEVSVEFLEVLAENSFDSILITDAGEGNITYTNKAFTTLTGHAAADVIGKSPKILQGEGTDQKVISRLAVALKSGGEFEGKAINFKKDGTPFIMFWRVVPVKIGGEIKAWMAIQRQGTHI